MCVFITGTQIRQKQLVGRDPKLWLSPNPKCLWAILKGERITGWRSVLCTSFYTFINNINIAPLINDSLTDKFNWIHHFKSPSCTWFEVFFHNDKFGSIQTACHLRTEIAEMTLSLCVYLFDLITGGFLLNGIKMEIATAEFSSLTADSKMMSHFLHERNTWRHP